MRGATEMENAWYDQMNISIHAPHAWCDQEFTYYTDDEIVISIHAPHAGCDLNALRTVGTQGIFQSTHPMRGATSCCAAAEIYAQQISIHAPHAGCDPRDRGAGSAGELHFNPRTPCGVRHKQALSLTRLPEFQSTHPMRGATAVRRLSCCRKTDFNPRTPCGVRRQYHIINLSRHHISIHAPHAGCDVRALRYGAF